MSDAKLSSDRRGFLSGVAATAAALGVGQLATAQAADPPSAASGGATQFEQWLNSIKGKHRQVYDAPEPNNGMALIYAFAYLLTAPQAYGVPESDIGAVVVLRRLAIPIAMNDEQWSKYKLGEVFHVTDPATKAPATRNPFAYVKPGDMPVPDAAVEKLVARDVRFAVCNLALTHMSGMVAGKMGLKGEDVKKDWVGGLLPGMTVVPSGVVAVNGAQAHGCSYCFAG